MSFFYKLLCKLAKISGRKISLITLGITCFSSSWCMEQYSLKSQPHSSTERRVVRILTVDGGERSIIPLTILERMEETLRSSHPEARLAHCFDLMAGISTGAFIVLGLNTVDQDTGQFTTASKLSKLYLNQEDEPFSAQDVNEGLENYFGDTWLSEAFSLTLVSAFNTGQKLAYMF